MQQRISVTFYKVFLYSNSPASVLFWTLCQKARSLPVWELCKIDICLLVCVRQLRGGRGCSIGLQVACAALIRNAKRDGPSLTFLTAQEGLACWRGRPLPDVSGPRQRGHGEIISTAHNTCHLASSHPISCSNSSLSLQWMPWNLHYALVYIFGVSLHPASPSLPPFLLLWTILVCLSIKN